MGLVRALRTLRRFRFAVLGIAVLAIAVGISVAYRFVPPGSLESKQYHIAIGSTTALVDSPTSQVVDIGGVEFSAVNINSLSGRANLLATVVTQSPIKDEIAAYAGLSPARLIAVSPVAPGGGLAASGVAMAAERDLSDPGAHILRATVPVLESGQVPMISIETQAPEPEQASRLANAAITVLRKHLDSVAASDRVPADRRLVVRQLGSASAEVQTRGPGKLMAAAAAIAVLGLGCGAILLLVALVGGWRAAAEFEQTPQPPAAFVSRTHENGAGQHVADLAVPPRRSPAPDQPAGHVPVRPTQSDEKAHTATDEPARKRDWASR